MSEKKARTHSNISNRVKAKQSLERKVVYKSALENPFRIEWPKVPDNVRNMILARIVAMMDNVAAYHMNREQASRKRKRARRADRHKPEQGDPQTKRRKKGEDGESPSADPNDHKSEPSVTPEELGSEVTSARDDLTAIAPPAALKHLVIGINEVTKRLESQVEWNRQCVTVSDAQKNAVVSSPLSPVKLVLVCQEDIDPPILIAHIPHLIACSNSYARHREEKDGLSGMTKLLSLPRGAENALACAMGLRRVAAMALDVDTPELSALTDLVEVIPTLHASWITHAISAAPREHPLIPTHIKQVRTSAPKDMRLAKQERAEGKAAAKERRKERPTKRNQRLKIVATDS